MRGLHCKIVIIFLISFVATLAGCEERQRTDYSTVRPPKTVKPLAAKKTSDPPCDDVEVDVQFVSISAPKGSKGLARLEYEISAAEKEPQAMVMEDPENPTGAAIELGFCSIRFEPAITIPKIISHQAKEALVYGEYRACLIDDAGLEIAQFHITEYSGLELQRKTIAAGYDMELISTMDRQLYLVDHYNHLGEFEKRVYGLEFTANTVPTRLELNAADGWNYAFKYPDGKLRVCLAEQLGNLPADLKADADWEEEKRERRRKSRW